MFVHLPRFTVLQHELTGGRLAVAVACKTLKTFFFSLFFCPLSQVAADRAEGGPGGQNNGSAVQGLWERI